MKRGRAGDWDPTGTLLGETRGGDIIRLGVMTGHQKTAMELEYGVWLIPCKGWLSGAGWASTGMWPGPIPLQVTVSPQGHECDSDATRHLWRLVSGNLSCAWTELGWDPGIWVGSLPGPPGL